MSRVYNFAAGPATLPLEVLQQAQAELLDWNGLGMSVMEISHRSPPFVELARQAEADLRQLLQIPQDYEVLFLQGGGRSQFAMVPLNLLGQKQAADYLDTGMWSWLALEEAKRYCQVNVVASSQSQGYTHLPPRELWQINPESAYFYYVDNETVHGVEFPEIPEVDLPLVSDMSSNLLSRPVDVKRFALLFAGVQKNIGPAGITIVIVRQDLLGKALSITPSMFNYTLHANEKSLYNTPVTFSWYMVGLVLKWLLAQGGVGAMAQKNQCKAEKLYHFIDTHDFYVCRVDPTCRSRMNVVFSLRDERHNEQFLREATAAGLANIKGHRLVGGMRASIYNALPEEAVDALITFMQDFSFRLG